jgi:2-desacetyl-2-hydroxyethyl bacteriochlorophyllide A dehydrogenase
MRAAIVTEPGHVEIREVEVPSPQANEVLVRLEGCGVCASNLSPWQGAPWFSYPFEPGQLGHEGWGRIVEAGSDAGEYSVGERVAILSNHAYAEYDVAPLESVVRLPAQLEGQAFPGEPLGCAMNIFRRSQITAGDTVAIIGIGFLGALLTRLASHAGAQVIAISRRPFSLQVARDMGAHETIAMEDHWQIIERVKVLTEGRFCDVVIEAVGKQWPLDLAAELTRERGRLIIAGYHQDGARQVNMQLWNWRGLDVINAHEREAEVYQDGIARAADAVASGVLRPAPLYTHCFPLEELAEALNATRDRPDGFMKALMIYS